MALFGHELTTLNLSAELRGSPLDNPAIPINSGAMWDWLSSGERTLSGESITEANALQISTVFSVVTLLATSVASLPLKLMERTASGHQEAVDADLHYLLSVQPNPEMGAFTLIECLVGSLALTGNCYAQIERNSLGQCVGLWPINPMKCEPVRIDGKLSYKVTDGQAAGTYRIVKPEDMLHCPLFCYDGIRGLSPIAMARQALGLAKATESFGSRLFGNGARPGGLIFNSGPKPDLKAQKELRDSWQEQQGGQNQGKIGFLFGGTWDYKSLGMTADESQFLATRNYQRAEICALWHMPPHFCGDMSRMSGNNAESEMIKYITMTLRPYTARLENEIIRKLMPTVGRKANKYFVVFDTTDMLKSDFKTAMEGYSAGRQGGWYSANDVRRKLGENPGGPELDVYVVAVNYQNAERLLDTESLQDQPVGGAVAPSTPTPAERDMYSSYIPLFRDAFGRLLHGSKRDLVRVDQLFRPVLRSIADAALGHNPSFPDMTGDFCDSVITDALRSMGKRVSKWPPELSEADKTAYASGEFTRAIRSIHVAVSRELAAKKAVAQLQLPEIEEYIND
jgi:HK97 family phage portal protein